MRPDGKASHPRYTYRVVSGNGSGVFCAGREFGRCSDAKKAAAHLAAQERNAKVKLGPYEIERVEHVSMSSRRYWMRRRSRWVVWNAHKDEMVREPDWIYGEPRTRT